MLSLCVIAWTETTRPFLICCLSDTVYHTVKIVWAKEAGSNRMLKKKCIMRNCMMFICCHVLLSDQMEEYDRQGMWNIQR